jgi:WD40 repeat protein/uncharacterized caspase-like protein/uncharacterized protein YecT (DUF1311 family)
MEMIVREVRRRLVLIGFTVAICVSCGSPAPAAGAGPSFDCATAKDPDEKTICASPELSALDVQAARKFQALLAKGNAAARVKARQSLKERNACLADAACIASVLASEIKAFDELGAPAQATGNTNPALPANPRLRDTACAGNQPQQDSGSGCTVRNVTTRDLVAPRTVARRGDEAADAAILSGNGQFVASSGPNGVKIWDVHSGRIIRSLFALPGDDLIRSAVIAFSPDGRRLLAKKYDTMTLWDTETGQPLIIFDKKHSASDENYSNSVVVAGGKRRVFSANYDDATIEIWDVNSAALIKSIKVPGARITSMGASPEENVVAIAGADGSVKCLDADTGRLISTLTAPADEHDGIIFSPDGDHLLTISYRDTRLWNYKTGQLVLSTESDTKAGDVTDVDVPAEFSSNGSRLMLFSKQDGIRIWDVNDRPRVISIAPPVSAVRALRFMPGAEALLVSGERETKVVDIATGKVIAVPYSLKGSILTKSTSGELLLFNEGEGTWSLRSASDGRSVQRFDLSLKPSLPTALASNGSVAAVADPSGDVVVRNTKSWTPSAGCHPDPAARSLEISADRRMVAATGWDGSQESITVCDLASGKPLDLPQKLAGRGATFSDDSRQLLVDRRVYDIPSGKLILEIGAEYFTAALPSGGKKLILGTEFDGVRVWDLAQRSELKNLRMPFFKVRSLAVSPDGKKVAAGGKEAPVKVWDANSGKPIRTFEDAETNEYSGTNRVPISSLAFDTGSSLLLASRGDLLVLWNVATGKTVWKIQAGMDGAFGRAFFADDAPQIVSLRDDGTIQHWDARTGALIATRMQLGNGEWVVTTPEGFFDTSSPTAAANLSVVKGLQVFSIDQFYNALYRPDLVREKLAGDPSGKVRDAAAKLDFDKVIATGAAPRVAITSPAPGSSQPRDSVEVEAAITEQGGGIGKIEWRVNGVTLSSDGRGFERVDAAASGGTPQIVKQTLSLVAGENRIEVLAYNAKNLIASEPARLTVRWDGENGATPPKLFVLSVGVNDYYDSRLRLAYAVPDATSIADGFRTAGSGLYAAVDVTTVLDKDVTAGNLDKVFAELGKKIQARDVFVFFLAGHGKTKNGKYFFIPRDFRYEDETSIEKAGVDQDRFQTWFAKIPARKSLLLYDTCESGSLTGSTRGSDIEERLGALNRMTRATGRTFLTATTDDAPAMEGFHGHGVFTYTVLDSLARGDVNNDGLIELSELADYVDIKVPDYSYEAFKLRQIPQRSMVGTNFALANKAAVLPIESSEGTSNAPIPTRPTHVLITSADVRREATPSSAVVVHMTPGGQVSLIELKNGWALVARDGQKLGFVEEKALLSLH